MEVLPEIQKLLNDVQVKHVHFGILPSGPFASFGVSMQE
jgi:hypothetical protein